MKKVGIIILMTLQFLSMSLNINAEECTTIVYYSKKEWVEFKNGIDTDFNQGDHSFVNTKGIECVLNTLGTISYPQVVDSSVLKGQSAFIQNEIGDQYSPVVFSISFGEEIEVGEIEFEIEAYNKKTGISLVKSVAINVDYPNQKTVISSTSKQDRMKLRIDKKAKNVYILFDSINEDNVYILKYFQINSYKQYKHVEWTKDKIDNTDTKRVEVCQGTGKYDPDGTSSVWKQSANTIFSPSVKIVNNYAPILRSQSVNYDWGRGRNTPAYTEPNSVKEMGGYAKEISGWKTVGSKPWIDYLSYGSYGLEYPFIPLNQDSGIQYFVNPMYWSQTKTAEYAYATSTDKNWCNHLTGSTKTPCYKSYGHSTNQRLNVYDVTIKNYDNVIDPELQKIQKVDYYLLNKLNNSEQFLFSAVEEVQSFDFNTTGIWSIKAVIQDMTGREGTKISESFYIDKVLPNAEFISDSYESEESIEVLLRPLDTHSGVNSWSYSLSNDGGDTFTLIEDNLKTKEEKVNFQNAGSIIIKIDVVDNAGNENTIVSNEYKVYKQTAQIDSIISFSYEKGKSNTAYAKIKCESCTIDNPQMIEIYLNDECIMKSEISDKLTNHQIDYISNKDKESSLSVKTQSEVMNLIIYEKTNEFKETDNNIIDFEAITASAINAGNKQVDFKEKAIITYNQDKEEYFSGEGIDAKIKINYSNECDIIDDFVCYSGVYDNQHPLPFGTVQLTLMEGAEPMREQYKIDNVYIVPLNYRAVDSMLILPQFYANQKTGEIDVTNDETMIEAGNKWYTHPRSEFGDYPIIAEGKQLGMNAFSWKINQSYSINESYKDLYNIKFIEPKNPFPNGDSDLWKNSLDWINDLNLNDIVKRIEISE